MKFIPAESKILYDAALVKKGVPLARNTESGQCLKHLKTSNLLI